MADTRPATPKEQAETTLHDVDAESQQPRPLKQRILAVLWDSYDKSPEERKFINKIDWWILSYCCIAYFVKYLDQTNVSHAPKLHFDDLY
jgi:ACS family pantothenate transporter-like MFS transporter